MCKSGYCYEDEEGYSACIGWPEWATAEGCSYNLYKSDQDRPAFSELQKNRCDGVYCFCHDQCFSGLCDLEQASCISKPDTYQPPKCNSTTLMRFCDFSANFYMTTNRCNQVSCNCDSQCQSGICDAHQCSSKRNYGESACSMQMMKILCNDTDEIISAEYNFNLCNGANSACSNLCLSKQSLNQYCVDQIQFPCNMTAVYNNCTYNSSGSPIEVTLSSTNRCENVPCGCDSQCQEGNFCNKTSGVCQMGERTAKSCNQSQFLCSAEYYNDSYQTTNRCDGNWCMYDQECSSNFCVNGTCQQLPPGHPYCFHTQFSVEFIGTEGKYFETDLNTNLCEGSDCRCSHQCGEGLICHYKSWKCEKSQSECNINPTECQLIEKGNIVSKSVKLNRCNAVECECHDQCQSGYCNQKTLMCEEMDKQRIEFCNDTLLFCGKKAANLCEGMECTCDNQCQSGLCMNRQCSSNITAISQGCTNKTIKCFYNENVEISFLQTNNKCLGISCENKDECQSGFCGKKKDDKQSSFYCINSEEAKTGCL
ncbi:hypothetical protein FGO68_gene13936 [Halteria grandinella]|uniref:Uncharacterized protein n=1 Tax=Halteria grandinella TaxID=5974 RepID=A0A8J8T6F0_HALGN|nr:hypothetical protein FGO68_gene13936 [Halteria grandinella]